MGAGRQPISPDDVIASRELAIEGQTDKVVVQLGRPYFADTGEAVCPFRFIYRNLVGGNDSYGVDAFQALELALKIVPTYLRTESYLPLGRMFAFDPGDDMGFPEVYQ